MVENCAACPASTRMTRSPSCSRAVPDSTVNHSWPGCTPSSWVGRRAGMRILATARPCGSSSRVSIQLTTPCPRSCRGLMTTSSSSTGSTSWSRLEPSARAIGTSWSIEMRRWPVSIRLSVEALMWQRPASASSDQPRATRSPRMRARMTASSGSSCVIGKILCYCRNLRLRWRHGRREPSPRQARHATTAGTTSTGTGIRARPRTTTPTCSTWTPRCCATTGRPRWTGSRAWPRAPRAPGCSTSARAPAPARSAWRGGSPRRRSSRSTSRPSRSPRSPPRRPRPDWPRASTRLRPTLTPAGRISACWT